MTTFEQMIKSSSDASIEALGAAGTGMDIEKTMITMVCSDFNAVEVEIPAEAYGVPMGEHVHAE